ncbi:MAG: hypothetical protein MK188_01310 [Gammaproteobacteria bacterium]|nr:hypothetical protein [Gammaproteobacteria bacterium]
MVVDSSDIKVGNAYTFSQIKDVVRITSGTVTSVIRDGRFVTILCAESGSRKIVDLAVISRIELLD